MFKKSIHGQFVNQFMNINVSKREREQFMNIHVSKRRSIRLSSFALRLFLSFPLSSSLFLSSSLCLFVSSSLFLSLPPLLSFFNVHSVQPANFLKTKDLRKRHFWLKFLSQRKSLRLKTLGVNSPNNSPTSPPTLHSTRRRNRPYILRRETLHHVRFYVGFANPTLHT